MESAGCVRRIGARLRGLRPVHPPAPAGNALAACTTHDYGENTPHSPTHTHPTHHFLSASLIALAAVGLVPSWCFMLHRKRPAQSSWGLAMMCLVVCWQQPIERREQEQKKLARVSRLITNNATKTARLPSHPRRLELVSPSSGHTRELLHPRGTPGRRAQASGVRDTCGREEPAPMGPEPVALASLDSAPGLRSLDDDVSEGGCCVCACVARAGGGAGGGNGRPNTPRPSGAARRRPPAHWPSTPQPPDRRCHAGPELVLVALWGGGGGGGAGRRRGREGGSGKLRGLVLRHTPRARSL